MNITVDPNAQMPQRAYPNQPCRQANIDTIVDFYRSGIKETDGSIGIELEHFLLHKADGSPVTYSEEKGVEWLLHQLETKYPEPTYDGDHDLIGISRIRNRILEAITLEPAAQVELSAGPFATLDKARDCLYTFEANLTALLDTVGEEIMLLGYQPTTRAQDTELIPKRRYKFMDLYLGNLGGFGSCMMRGTASTQVSIDFTSEQDCLRKMRLANAMVPMLSLITDNSPIFEGRHRPHELMRTEVWKYCDPDRCGLVPGVMDDDFTLEHYAEYVLDTPAILIPCATHDWCYEEKTFGEIYATTPMTRAEAEHAVSMLFNDVRLKTYIEIRPADAMPQEFVIAYAALIKGMFAVERNLKALEQLFVGVRGADVVVAKEELMQKGYDATVYGRPVTEITDRMCALAKEGLSEAERHYLNPLNVLIANRATLADLTLAG